MEPISFEDFAARMVIVLALYGALLVESNNALAKPKLWRWSVLLGLLGNGISGIGYLIPDKIPNPDRWGLITNAIFLTGVFFSYLLAINTEEAKQRRNAIYREMGIATLACITIGVVVANIRTKAEVLETNENISAWMESVDKRLERLDRKGQGRDNRLDNLEARSKRASEERTAILINQGYIQQDLTYLRTSMDELIIRLGAKPRAKRTPPATSTPPIPVPKQLPPEKPGIFKRWFGRYRPDMPPAEESYVRS